MKVSATRILFVCLGNICRSPAAEVVCRHLAAERQLALSFNSCGTASYHVGEKPDGRMIKALAAQDFHYDGHRARQFNLLDFDRFDLIIAQDDANKAALLARAQKPEHAAKLHCMKEWFPQPWAQDYKEVPDPYYSGPAAFDDVVSLLRAACTSLLDSID